MHGISASEEMFILLMKAQKSTSQRIPPVVQIKFSVNLNYIKTLKFLQNKGCKKLRHCLGNKINCSARYL